MLGVTAGCQNGHGIRIPPRRTVLAESPPSQNADSSHATRKRISAASHDGNVRNDGRVNAAVHAAATLPCLGAQAALLAGIRTARREATLAVSAQLPMARDLTPTQLDWETHITTVRKTLRMNLDAT